MSELTPLDNVVEFITPARGGLSDLLCDRLCAYRPLGDTIYDAGEGFGERPATLCRVVALPQRPNDDQLFEDLGELPVPWAAVRTELAKANAEAPWVVGRMVRKEKANFLNPPSPTELVMARRGLRAWIEDTAAAAKA